MKQITLARLSKKKSFIEVLRLLSHDPDLYLGELVIDGESHLLTDESRSPLSFRSMLAAKKPFKGMRINRAELVQKSPYDEMIAQPVREKENTLRVNITLPDADLS